MPTYRIEHDSMGEMRVPADALWGAQTQRSYENFRIGTETQPEGIIRAFALLKKAAAQANVEGLDAFWQIRLGTDFDLPSGLLVFPQTL